MVSEALMEDRCLNITQPILSVRRGSSTSAVTEVHKSKTSKAASNIPPLPYYKSDIKSGPIRNPGVIPFQWEQSPGRPKDETTQSQTKAYDSPAAAPSIPSPTSAQYHCGRSLDKSSKDSHASKPQLVYDSAAVSDTSSRKNTPEFEKPEADGEENGSLGSGDENLTYQDALDTLSRCDSFLNCSLSGLSGLDRSDMRLSGPGSNQQARDFMMDRFLPAAKAVASDTPQCGSRKQQPVCKEEAVDVKKIITRNQGNPRNHCILESLAYPRVDDGIVVEDDDEDEYEGTENFSSTKLCGLLPRLCLLNPLPGIRYPAPAAAPVSPVEIQRKPTSVGAHMKNQAKVIIDAVQERKRQAVYQRSDMRSSNGPNHLNNELRKFPIMVDPSKLDEAQLNCSGKDGTNIAPYRSSSRHSLMQKERGLLGVPEAPRSSWPVKGTSPHRNARLRQLLVSDQSQSIREEPSSYLPDHATAVKTLYIDSAHGAEYQDSNSSSSESRSRTDSRGRNPSIDYSLQDMNEIYSASDKTFLQLRCTDSSAQHESETPAVDMGKNLKDFSAMHGKVESVSSVGFNLQDSHLAGGSVQHSKKEELIMQDKNLVLSLALPNSPSESWLSRALLPSASSRTAQLKMYLGVGNQCSRASPVHPQWESSARSSDSSCNQLTASMLTPISEN